MTLIRANVLLTMALAIAACCTSAFTTENTPLDSRDTTAKIVGTWRGESICVGYRPACKNEDVVYRFATVAGRTDLVTLYADKVLDGKRIPMYKLDFVYDEEKGTLSGEFTRRQTHGLWRYQLSGDVLEGTLRVLPGKEIGRKGGRSEKENS